MYQQFYICLCSAMVLVMNKCYYKTFVSGFLTTWLKYSLSCKYSICLSDSIFKVKDGTLYLLCLAQPITVRHIYYLTITTSALKLKSFLSFHFFKSVETFWDLPNTSKLQWPHHSRCQPENNNIKKPFSLNSNFIISQKSRSITLLLTALLRN